MNFKTFAYRRIRGAILDELRRNSPLPQKMLKQIAQVRRVCETLPSPVTPETIQRVTGLSEDEVEQTLEAMRLGFSQAWDDAKTVVGGLRQACEERPDSRAKKWNSSCCWPRPLSVPEKERLVITLYYLEDLRLKEIGAVLDLSESRISRILSKAEFRVAECIRARWLNKTVVKQNGG